MEKPDLGQRLREAWRVFGGFFILERERRFIGKGVIPVEGEGGGI